MNRPFYTDFAWAYDLIIDGRVSSRVNFIEQILSDRNFPKERTILDAGWGTGSISYALAQRGFNV